MKFVPDAAARNYADPEKAARKILEIANAAEAVQDGRIHIEKINGPFLFREGGTLAKKIIAQNLREEISALILKLVSEDKPTNTITREIAKLAPEISKKRAAVIARTETHQLALAAIDQTLRYKKISVKSKTWWANLDSRVRASHREAHGQVVAYDQAFGVGCAQMMRPGDPNGPPEEVISCRCSCLFGTSDVTTST